MRKGQNPAKFVNSVPQPERITATLLNYIPFLSGFYAETLDVLKVCLESMRKDAGLPFDLMVFDNGSCAEVRDFLIGEKDAGRIQYLILSEKNMGKGGAWIDDKARDICAVGQGGAITEAVVAIAQGIAGAVGGGQNQTALRGLGAHGFSRTRPADLFLH